MFWSLHHGSQRDLWLGCLTEHNNRLLASVFLSKCENIIFLAFYLIVQVLYRKNNTVSVRCDYKLVFTFGEHNNNVHNRVTHKQFLVYCNYFNKLFIMLGQIIKNLPLLFYRLSQLFIWETDMIFLFFTTLFIIFHIDIYRHCRRGHINIQGVSILIWEGYLQRSFSVSAMCAAGRLYCGYRGDKIIYNLLHIRKYFSNLNSRFNMLDQQAASKFTSHQTTYNQHYKNAYL